MRIAYLGPAGTNSEVAALRVYPAADYLACPTIVAAIRAVEHGRADAAVVPIENSLQGAVTDTVDLLVQDDGIAIAGEYVLDIEHCLMVRPGADRSTLQVIYSHPQSLGQCRRYLEREFPDVRTVAALSNAEAVAIAMETADAGAIGPARAAEIYGAQIIDSGIQDARVNKTRFVVIAAHGAHPTGHDKTSLAFGVAHDRPGTLVSVLHEFSDRAINLTRIESRPSGEQLGVYVFLIDVEGHRQDPLVAQALAAVREQSDFFKVFGSYPVARNEAADPDAPTA
ncbi:MAG: prephenate dehydratase [Chloroflexi bacterium]|nr:prephenate dehydratase [Chloroflexota bacterium]